MGKEKQVDDNANMHKQPKKLSYEELTKVASELQQQGQKLFQENQQLKNQINNQGPIIRMEFLFKVLENKDMFPVEYTIKVSEEIMEGLHSTQEVAEEEIVEEEK